MSELIKYRLKLICLLVLTLFSSSLVANMSVAEDDEYLVDTETFEIPGHGELILKVPRIWNYNFTKVDEQTPPLITFYVLDKNKREIFQLNMSIFINTGYNKNITDIDYIHSLVFTAGKNILPHSDENELLMMELSGKQGKGFFFDLSDRDAAAEEYKFLTQGAIALQNVLLVFSLFSNEEQGILREALLTTVKSARHIDREDI
ncbi:MAG: hypothetical protein AAF419_01895 [Pseudomonadota bacterium]